MKRGDIWTIAGGGDYAGKPRPAVIIQDDSFDATNSITICPFTTHTTDMPIFRLLVEPTPGNGLRVSSRIMVDKVMTVRRTKLREHVGKLAAADVTRLNRAIAVFLGIAGGARSAEATESLGD